MQKIEIIDIVRPDWAAVRSGRPGQELIVTFTVDGEKFRMTYIQEHYFYRGMPGVWHERLKFQKIRLGEVKYEIDCDGEFKIPHYPGAVAAYARDTYDGDDPRYLNADEAIVREYLVEPFVKRYF